MVLLLCEAWRTAEGGATDFFLRYFCVRDKAETAKSALSTVICLLFFTVPVVALASRVVRSGSANMRRVAAASCVAEVRAAVSRPWVSMCSTGSLVRCGGFEAEGLTATLVVLGSGASSQQLRPKMCGHLHLPSVCLVLVLAFGAVARTWPRSVFFGLLC